MTDELTDFTDILPTLVEIAGAEEFVPEGSEFDGTSLVPFLRGDTDTHREWIYAYISGSQLLRTKNYMLEVVNPILGMPRGRLYYTGDNRFGHGYELITDALEHQAARALFDSILKQFPAVTRDHEYFSTKRGAEFLAKYEDEKTRNKHLYSHRDYDFYEQTYAE